MISDPLRILDDVRDALERLVRWGWGPSCRACGRALRALVADEPTWVCPNSVCPEYERPKALRRVCIGPGR